MAWIAEGLHKTRDGHLVPAGAVVPGLRSRDPDAWVQIGHGATIQGGIEHAGGVVLARGVCTWAGIAGGHEVIIGPGCTIKGPVHAEGRIVVQSGAQVGDLHAGSDVHLLGDCQVGKVHAVGDILVVGAPQTQGLAPGGRITTRPW